MNIELLYLYRMIKKGVRINVSIKMFDLGRGS